MCLLRFLNKIIHVSFSSMFCKSTSLHKNLY